jgi:hypothetical protein
MDTIPVTSRQADRGIGGILARVGLGNTSHVPSVRASSRLSGARKPRAKLLRCSPRQLPATCYRTWMQPRFGQMQSAACVNQKK